MSWHPRWSSTPFAPSVRQALLVLRPTFWNREWPPLLGITTDSHRCICLLASQIARPIGVSDWSAMDCMQRQVFSVDWMMPMLWPIPPTRTRFHCVLGAPASVANPTAASLVLSQLLPSPLARAVRVDVPLGQGPATQKFAVAD